MPPAHGIYGGYLRLEGCLEKVLRSVDGRRKLEKLMVEYFVLLGHQKLFLMKFDKIILDGLLVWC